MSGWQLKDYEKESQAFTRRVLQVVFIVVVLIAILVARAVYLQVIEHHRYSTLSRNNYIRVVPLPPKRGLIFDRNGVLLAENRPVYNLEIRTDQVKKVNQTIHALKNILPVTENDIATYKKQRQLGGAHDSIPLMTGLTQHEVARFAVDRHRFPGVYVTARLARYYPQGKETVSVLGYVGRMNEADIKRVNPEEYRGVFSIGKIGIEKYYEEALKGQSGYEEVEVDAHGRQVRVVKRVAPMPGNNLNLTIDSRLQRFALNALKGKRGAVVAIEPKTGQVLALVSAPSYDPNLFVNGIAVSEYQALKNSPTHPLFNRALRGQYPPASTVKPFMGLLGLDDKVVTSKTSIKDPGWYRIKGTKHKFRDWKKKGHGKVNLKKAIVESCDTYFYWLSHQLGIDRMYTFMKQFGFGEKTGIDLPDELGGVYPNTQWKRQVRGKSWYTGETLIAGIGQGYVQATPLQLASAVGVIAMRGQRMKPYVLLQQVPVHGDRLVTPPFKQPAVVLSSKSYWNKVTKAMVAVVKDRDGTAHYLNWGLKYPLAGKTGTAQVFSLGEDIEASEGLMEEHHHLRNHTWFIAFAPVKNPKIAVAVVLENNKGAAKIARKVMDFYLIKRKEVS